VLFLLLQKQALHQAQQQIQAKLWILFGTPRPFWASHSSSLSLLTPSGLDYNFCDVQEKEYTIGKDTTNWRYSATEDR
jgi:hypothetical protein